MVHNSRTHCTGCSFITLRNMFLPVHVCTYVYYSHLYRSYTESGHRPHFHVARCISVKYALPTISRFKIQKCSQCVYVLKNAEKWFLASSNSWAHYANCCSFFKCLAGHRSGQPSSGSSQKSFTAISHFWATRKAVVLT